MYLLKRVRGEREGRGNILLDLCAVLPRVTVLLLPLLIVAVLLVVVILVLLGVGVTVVEVVVVPWGAMTFHK